MKSAQKLGKLVRVPLREIWKHEALDLTTWLAENIDELGEALEIELLEPRTEVSVGGLKVDIECEDSNGRKVIIENQLEKTDHSHLGQILTYASGLEAEVIIWVSPSVREEHEQAVNWLNENTNEKLNFFLVQIEAYRIGDSDPAPHFNIIAQPNNWAKQAKSSVNGSLSDTKILQAKFWSGFREYAEGKTKYVKSLQKALPQHWYNVAIGSYRANIALTINTKDSKVGVELYVHDGNRDYDTFFKHKEAIESSLNLQPEWRELPDKKASRIITFKDFKFNFTDETKWPELFEWLLNTAESFAKTFKKYV